MMRPEEPTEPATQQEQALAVLRLAARIAEGEAVSSDLTARLRALPWDPAHFPGAAVRPLLTQLLLGRDVETALQWLHDSGVLAALLPEVEATVDFVQEMGRKHKDVWKHTKQVVAQCVTDEAVRWAALLHDIGKVPTRATTPEGKVTFHGHPEAGARLFDRICRRIVFAKPLRSRVRFLILHHLRANQYDSGWTDSAVRRFDREMGEHLETLLQLSRADITSTRRERREQALQQIEELDQRIRALREIDARKPPLPSGLGNLIMDRFGLEPGRRIGELRRALEEAVQTGELEPQREADYYLEHIAKRGLAPEAKEEP
jgi:poly(A) polymerase